VLVEVQLLGGFAVRVDGSAVAADAWPRRHAAALVKLLALAPGHRLHRDQVLDALWPDVEPAVAARRFHKAAHYARRAIGVDDAVHVAHDTVALFPDANVVVDVERFDDAVRTGNVDEALRRYTGELLPDDRYEDWAFVARERVALRHRELLRAAERWDDLVALDPTDEVAQVAIMHRLLDGGDHAAVRRRFEALERALHEELGIGPSREAIECYDRAHAPAVVLPPLQRAPRHSDLATQTIRFCTTPDGVRLAYALSGDGPPLVKPSNWLTHLDYDWESPVWRPWWQTFSARHTLVRYDERGCGMSQRDIDDVTLDAWVSDLETVVDTLGIERFPLLGISQGGPIAIRYAVRHPERVSHVVVYGTCARSTWQRANADERRELAALTELLRLSWGADKPGWRSIFNERFLPDGPIELWRAFDELQRRSSSTENAVRLWKAFAHLDISDDASRLDVPTLVLHARDDAVWGLREAEELVELVPGARLVVLESKNHILQGGEPAFAAFVDEVERFVAS
jgi:DNA-binding SARP family transcriptional activator/pimeloyl-ACP methyl ester carboxylesterase